MLKSIAATFLAFLALCGAAPAALAQTDAATAETLMRESGLWKQLEGIAPQMRSGLRSALSQGQLDGPQVELVAGMAEEAFAAERLRASARAVIGKRTKQRHVAALLAWYRSPQGVALTRLEEAAAFESREEEVGLREDSALLASLPARRQALLKQLVKVTRADEALTNLVINTSLAIHAGVASASPQGALPPVGELRAALELQRPEMLAAHARIATAALARTYAGVPDATLERYGAFLKSPAGSHFMAVATQGMNAALVEAGADFGRSMPESRARVRI